jgi:DNA-binding transcriptional LysR family regulator
MYEPSSPALRPALRIMIDMHIGGLRFNQLQLIEALARTGNITDAAKHVGITQSAASHALARLRRSMQDPIFIRTSEGMKPTPYGARLAAAVRDATRLLEYGLDRSPEFDPARSTRTFNIFMSDVGQWLFLPRFLQGLASSAPGISLRVRPLPAKAAHLMLESGEVDIGVGTFTSLITGCMQRRLYQGRYVCVVRKDHPSFLNGMTLEAFRSVPHAVADGAGYVHEALDRWLARQKVQRRVKVNVPHYLVLPLIVARSDLLAITAGRVAEMFATMLPLNIMPLPMKSPSYDINVFWHERFHRDPANRWIRHFVANVLKE